MHTSGIYDLHDLIPKDREYDFTDEISICAHLDLETKDSKELESLFSDVKFTYTKSYDMSFMIKLSIQFTDGKVISKTPKVEIYLKILGTFGKKKTEIELTSDSEARLKLHKFIAKRLPSVIYYPNFLLDFPERIQLEYSQNEQEYQKFYRRFLQDILDSFNASLDVERSIVQKQKSMNIQDRKALEQILRKMAVQIEKVVFRDDFKMLSNRNKTKSIEILPPEISSKTDLNLSGENFNPLTLEIKIRDGANNFAVQERSLGFGWLFTFLLITHFRLMRKHASMPVFIFDEPASNLHATYQMNLITAISELVKDEKAIVIYSTHSHYMINPDWLGAAYIVRNEAVNYDDLDPFDRPPTDIKVQTYRSFAVKHPDQRTYFQPILDVLEYKPSNLELIQNALIVEGKSDFYFLSVLKKMVSDDNIPLAIVPGTGSTNMTLITSLYIGWSRNFVIILDDDEEGRKSKKAYQDKWGAVIENRVFTLVDIDQNWNGYEIEDLLESSDKLSLISKVTDVNERVTKKVCLLLLNICLSQIHSQTFLLKLWSGLLSYLLLLIPKCQKGQQYRPLLRQPAYLHRSNHTQPLLFLVQPLAYKLLE